MVILAIFLLGLIIGFFVAALMAANKQPATPSHKEALDILTELDSQLKSDRLKYGEHDLVVLGNLERKIKELHLTLEWRNKS